jgi:XTP/dITP diphosphohydrolase
MHKFEEVTDFFKDTKVEFTHLNIQYPELQADTFNQIVYASASLIATTAPQPFLIEDSGLSVHALNNFPGPYSSYVFQTVGWNGILDLLKNTSERSAKFTSTFALVINDKIELFKGVTRGTISTRGIGDGGFGFDPIFIPDIKDDHGAQNIQTYAEMSLSLKNKISHRARSMAKLREFLLQA